MRYHKFFHVCTALTVIILGLFSLVSGVQAKSAALVTPTILTIQAAESVPVGESLPVVVQLTTSRGKPIVDEPIELFVDGELERRARTDATGNVSVGIRLDVVGTFKLNVVFKGSKPHALAASKASTELVIVPAIIEVQTVPPLPKIRFSLGNRIFSSNKDGIARIAVEKAGTYTLKLLSAEVSEPDIQMKFSRWADDTFLPSRDIKIPLNKPLQVGFEVSYLVSHTFVDLAGRPVDPARITSVTIKGSEGTTYTFEDNQPHWLPAGRVTRLSNGLEQTKFLYSVISVTIDGSNVVSQAQQRFYVQPNDVWSLKLLLYSARFTARDALFRFPIGSGIQVEYPDGDSQSFSFNSDDEYLSSGLARGIYRVTVTGADGIAPATPIALSRDQDVELLVLSYFDIGVMVTLAIAIALGLLFFGRPQLFTQMVAFPRRVVPRNWAFPSGNFLQLAPQLITLGNRVASQSWTPRPRIGGRDTISGPYDVVPIESQPEQVSLSPLDMVIPSSYVLPQTPANSATQNETPVILVERLVDLDLTSEKAEEVVSIPAESLDDNAIDHSSEVEVIIAPAPAQEPSHTSESLAASDAPSVLPDMPLDKTGDSIQQDITQVCQVCGSSEIVRVGTNRRGKPKYHCQACGAYDVYKSKKASPKHQKRAVESLP